MFDSFLFDSRALKLPSRAFILGISALALVACGGGGTKATVSSSGASSGSSATKSMANSEFLIDNDHVTGSDDAPVTLVEYASVACGACANWHNAVYPDFKKKYVDTGKVRYVFREYVTGVPEYADAGFMIALCAGEDNYFKNISFQFKRQAQIFKMGSEGKARDAYIGIAKSAGLSEEEFIGCMQNQELREQYRATMQTGIDLGVSGTPAFFINGEKYKAFTLESLEDIILPILGEPIPDRSDAKESAE